jgi:hypothetical protein
MAAPATKRIFRIETLEKFVVRCQYFVRAKTAAAAKRKVKNGKVAYKNHKIEEGDEEFLSIESCKET